jgi:hypothetical protein
MIRKNILLPFYFPFSAAEYHRFAPGQWNKMEEEAKGPGRCASSNINKNVILHVFAEK